MNPRFKRAKRNDRPKETHPLDDSDHLRARSDKFKALTEPARKPEFSLAFRGYTRRQVDDYVEHQRRQLVEIRARALRAEDELVAIPRPRGQVNLTLQWESISGWHCWQTTSGQPCKSFLAAREINGT